MPSKVFYLPTAPWHILPQGAMLYGVHNQSNGSKQYLMGAFSITRARFETKSADVLRQNMIAIVSSSLVVSFCGRKTSAVFVDHKQMRIVVYADGGCEPNPGTGGWGAVISGIDGAIELYGGELATTNNRMELTAAIRALEHFHDGAQVEMRCDSQYVVKSITEWMPGWKARGWRTSKGFVQNLDLMQRLDELNSLHDVCWIWVRGHSGDPRNERADRLAAQGRREVLR